MHLPRSTWILLVLQRRMFVQTSETQGLLFTTFSCQNTCTYYSIVQWKYKLFFYTIAWDIKLKNWNIIFFYFWILISKRFFCPTGRTGIYTFNGDSPILLIYNLLEIKHESSPLRIWCFLAENDSFFGRGDEGDDLLLNW